ncbi:MAG: NAD(P)-dependent oxidoreductase, partial [Rhodothermales bacterium]
MQTIAILGASGFIGSRAVEMLHLGGVADVRPIVRTAARLAPLSRFDLDARIADARHQEALEAAFSGCDVVVHTVAGSCELIRSVIEPVYCAACRAGVGRLIYLSSASVHGQAPLPGTDEETALPRRHALPYNGAKAGAEQMLLRLRKKGDVEVVVLRPGIVYGPRSSWIGGFADTLLR